MIRREREPASHNLLRAASGRRNSTGKSGIFANHRTHSWRPCIEFSVRGDVPKMPNRILEILENRLHAGTADLPQATVSLILASPELPGTDRENDSRPKAATAPASRFPGPNGLRASSLRVFSEAVFPGGSLR